MQEDTTDERRENVFTGEDRITLTRIDDQCKQINGSVKRHDEEIFGDENKGTPGLKSTVAGLVEFMVQVKTAIVVIVTLLSLIGITNLVILFRTAT